MPTLAPTEVELLLRVLAQVEALFAPLRWQGDSYDRNAAAIYEKRMEYAKTGLYFPAGGSSADRQIRSRILSSLAGKGLLTTSGGTATYLRFTERGEQYSRLLTPIYPTEERYRLLAEVARLTDLGYHNKGYVLEVDVLGFTKSYKEPDVDMKCELIALEDKFNAFLFNGWLDSNSDSDGRVGYKITDDGRKGLADGIPAPMDEQPEYTLTNSEHYTELLNAAEIDRNTWRPRGSNLLAIPLSCGLWKSPPREQIA